MLTAHAFYRTVCTEAGRPSATEAPTSDEKAWPIINLTGVAMVEPRHVLDRSLNSSFEQSPIGKTRPAGSDVDQENLVPSSVRKAAMDFGTRCDDSNVFFVACMITTTCSL